MFQKTLWALQNPVTYFWWRLAKFLSKPNVRGYLITRSMRTPYKHITSSDGSDTYMFRYWLFNPYPWPSGSFKWWQLQRFLPSVRIHKIMRADNDRHDHDHPWNARTVILDKWYAEQRKCEKSRAFPDGRKTFFRETGDTVTLKFGEYHRISAVPKEGVYTLFITWRYRGMWGFDVDGVKVPWREYDRAGPT